MIDCKHTETESGPPVHFTDGTFQTNVCTNCGWWQAINESGTPFEIEQYGSMKLWLCPRSLEVCMGPIEV